MGEAILYPRRERVTGKGGIGLNEPKISDPLAPSWPPFGLAMEPTRGKSISSGICFLPPFDPFRRIKRGKARAATTLFPFWSETLADIPIGTNDLTFVMAVKALGLAESGGQAKFLIREGHYELNGEVNIIPGKKLKVGDKIGTRGQCRHRVVE